jgi:sphingomyelin phosphodiesterase
MDGMLQANLQLTESLFRHLSSLDPAPDFILYTGDDPAHDVTQQTRESNLAVINRLSSLFVHYLPTIPIFFALGKLTCRPS